MTPNPNIDSLIERLRECPFCGARAELVERSNPMSKWRHSVDCTSSTCGMSGPVEATRAAAIAAWNRRAPSAEVERLKGERDQWRETASVWRETARVAECIAAEATARAEQAEADRDAARAQALEEAAGIAKRIAEECRTDAINLTNEDGDGQAVASGGFIEARRVAKAIRALADKQEATR